MKSYFHNVHTYGLKFLEKKMFIEILRNVPFSSQLSANTNIILLSFVQQAAKNTNFVPVSSNTIHDKYVPITFLCHSLHIAALAMSCTHISTKLSSDEVLGLEKAHSILIGWNKIQIFYDAMLCYWASS